MSERDAARQMREHIDAAHAAAEQLVREAEEQARSQASGVPPRGWDVPRSTEERPALPELGALVAMLESVKGSIPSELTSQLAEALRELLVAVRALIDWYIERLDRFTPGDGPAAAPAGEPRVQDIPID